MDSLKRQKLKDRFRNGSLPTQEDFAALIESFVHLDEFSSWTQKGSIDLGALGGRRWRLSCPDGKELRISIVPDGGDAPTAGSDELSPETAGVLRVAGWMAMPARRGTFRQVGAAEHQGEAPDDGGPPSPVAHVRADDTWHAVVQSVSGCAAFEIVAQTGETALVNHGWWTRLTRSLGLSAPASGVLHGIAVSAGRGSRPTLRATLAPSIRGRLLLQVSAALSVVVSLIAGTYAAFLVPAKLCPVPWGASCFSLVFDKQPGLMGLATTLVFVAAGLLVLLWGRRNARLRVSWRKTSDGKSQDLCLRAPKVPGGPVFYHITRLW